jgi:uncharacterized membrane protein YuzA (DUF378 family)
MIIFCAVGMGCMGFFGLSLIYVCGGVCGSDEAFSR